MFVIDTKGAQWSIDEGLRDRAGALMEAFPEQIGYIDLEKIIFLRLTGAAKSKWLGKCMYIGKCPMNIIPKFVTQRLFSMGLLDLKNTSMSEEDIDLFDLRYIITINDDLIQQANGDLQKVEDITLLHELMHIHPDGDKLIKHDIEDFVALVDLFGAHWTEGIFKADVIDPVSGEVLEEASPVLDFKGFTSAIENWSPPESD